MLNQKSVHITGYAILEVLYTRYLALFTVNPRTCKVMQRNKIQYNFSKHNTFWNLNEFFQDNYSKFKKWWCDERWGRSHFTKDDRFDRNEVPSFKKGYYLKRPLNFWKGQSVSESKKVCSEFRIIRDETLSFHPEIESFRQLLHPTHATFVHIFFLCRLFLLFF